MSSNINLDKRLPLKQIALEIFLQTISRIDPEKLVAGQIRRDGHYLSISDELIDLAKFDCIIIIGFGKASLKMAASLRSILADRKIEGIVATNGLLGSVRITDLEVIVGGHPYPDAGSLYAASRAVELVSSADESTLIFHLISGGGSSLFEKPLDEGISLGDLQQLNKLLVTCGATIREINTVRKHLSAVKGGRLAMLAPDSKQISLYISDVNCDELSTIASDPTGPDDTTLDEFYGAIEKYGLLRKMPSSIANLISERAITETPKNDDVFFNHIKRHLLIDNKQVLSIAANLATKSGWSTEIDANNNEQHYRVVADRLLDHLRELASTNPTRPVCIVSGGEVICPVHGYGIGGRNQEFVLYCGMKLKELFPDSEIAILSAGTDGIDGNSDAAGAVVDQVSLEAQGSGLLAAEGFLESNDSYHYFKENGGSIITGPTGTNVRDLRLLFLRPSATLKNF
jgi:glycerate 2-kinase